MLEGLTVVLEGLMVGAGGADDAGDAERVLEGLLLVLEGLVVVLEGLMVVLAANLVKRKVKARFL